MTALPRHLISIQILRKIFTGFVNGKPVGTSLLFLTDHAAGIYFDHDAGRSPEKGIGLELTQATMRYAGIAGAPLCHTPVLAGRVACLSAGRF